jgi:hypothetical protein
MVCVAAESTKKSLERSHIEQMNVLIQAVTLCFTNFTTIVSLPIRFDSRQLLAIPISSS